MPAARGTERFCEAAELAVDAIHQVAETVTMIMADGVVTDEEHHLWRVTVCHAFQVVQPLPAMAAQVDNALRLIGAAAGAGAVTPWVERIAREAARDAA